MAAIYIPGWADQLLASGLPQQLGGILANKFNPEGVANRKFKQLVQDNPMIMQQFANMPIEQRQAMAQAMGMSTTPQSLMNLPESPQVAIQRRTSEFLQNATPEQLELMTAGQLQTKTKGQLEREAEEYDFTKRMNSLKIDSMTRDNEIQKILGEEKKRLLAELETARKNHPDIDVQGLVNRLVQGKIGSQDMQAFQVLAADHGPMLQSMMDFEKLRQQTASGLALRRTDNEDNMTRLMISATESARKAYDDANSFLKQIISSSKIASVNLDKALQDDPQFKANYDAAVRAVDDAKKRYDMYAPIVAKKFGIEMPALNTVVPGQAPPGLLTQPGAAATPPGTETPEQRRARLLKAARGGG